MYPIETDFEAIMTCPRCQEGSILFGETKGSIETEFLGNSYLSSAAEVSTSHTKAIVIFSDGFGLDIANPKLIADELAKQLHCDVWVPDYFLGKPLITANSMVLADHAGVKITMWQWIKFVFTVGIPNIGSLWRNRPSVLDQRVEEFIAKLKEGRGYEQIGAVGYCYGGAAAVRFASRPDLFTSVVMCHPARFTIEDVSNVKIPSLGLVRKVRDDPSRQLHLERIR